MCAKVVKTKKVKTGTSRQSPAATPPLPAMASVSSTVPSTKPAVMDAVEPLECCICVEPPLHPVKLPCSHIFCFLCIKGVFISDGKCPLCRKPIPKKCIEHPTVMGESPKVQGSKKRKRSDVTDLDTPIAPSTPSTPSTPTVVSPPRQVWFYEGRGGGWWQYDERTMVAIEDALTKGQSSLDVLLAGTVYVLDFVAKVQMRKDNPSLKRQMKRDFVDGTVKGVAGLLVTQK